MCCNTDGPSWVARTGVTEGVRHLNITDFNFRSYFQNLWRHTNCTISLSKSIWRLGEYTEKHHLGWLSSCALSWALAFGWCWGLDLGNQIHQHFSYLFWQRFSSACKSVDASGRSKLAMKVLCHTQLNRCSLLYIYCKLCISLKARIKTEVFSFPADCLKWQISVIFLNFFLASWILTSVFCYATVSKRRNGVWLLQTLKMTVL